MWKWVDGSSANYTSWRLIVENDIPVQNRSQACAFIDNSGRWNVIPCDGTYRDLKFTCQRPTGNLTRFLRKPNDSEN